GVQSPIMPPPIPGMVPTGTGGVEPVIVPPAPNGAADPASIPGLVLPPMQGLSTSSAPPIPAELTHGLPPEFIQMIAPQFEQKPVRKRINPMIIIGLGAIGMILLLLIAAMATIVLQGS
ncbi:MAG: hypothetical protein M3Y37_09470, partial [Chloroflexota bacterium]|nr:hypothetical protein [Chloroflexota bacterium]